MCYTALTFIYERKKVLHRKRLKRSAQMRIFAIFLAKGDQGNSGKRYDHFSIQYWHVTVIRRAYSIPDDFLRSLSTGCQLRRIESRDRFQLRSLRQKDRAARLWVDFLIAASRRRIARFSRWSGPSFCIVAFFALSAFFLSRVRQV